MYQTFQIDEEEEHNQKPRNNQFEFANKYSNFLQPNFITGQEDQYHQHLESNPASSHKIVSQDVSFASNNQPQPKQGSISNFQKQQEQFYEQKVHQKEELKKISKINNRVIKKEQLHEPNEPQLKNDIAKPSTKHNILFLYEDEEELVQQVKPPQDIHIPHRQINQIFGLDSEIISEDEVTTVTKTSQYFDIQDKEVLSRQLLACIERLHLLKIEIARQNSGTNLFWPEYQMRFHKEPGICFAKRTTARPIATYLFSSSANQFDETLTSYIGKIKTNIIGNILYIYGPGLNPKNAESKGVPPRQMLATIVYQTSFMNQTKPRSFTVYVKHPDKSYFSFKGMKVGDEIGLDELFISSGENRDHISMYQNSKPVWSSKVGGFMLNFKGRVKQPSVKNFILQDMNANEVMMFGKRAQNLFNIEVKDRFSPLVTFGIALSSFDSKFLCQ